MVLQYPHARIADIEMNDVGRIKDVISLLIITHKEYCDVINKPMLGIILERAKENRRLFTAVLVGPKDSPYVHGQIVIEFFYP